MILHFPDHETAALFTAQRRSEGYFARTLDGNCSHLWGALPVHGARVVVSSEPVDGAPAPPVLVWSKRLIPFLNLLVLALVLGGILLIAVHAMRSAQLRGMSTPQPSDPFSLIGPVLTLLLVIPMSIGLIHWTRDDRLRPPGTAVSGKLRFIVILMILL